MARVQGLVLLVVLVRQRRELVVMHGLRVLLRHGVRGVHERGGVVLLLLLLLLRLGLLVLV